jgi:hypothetical protein
MVSPIMAYNELGYELVKAWCNNDVQNYISDKRKVGNYPSGADASYRAFEEFAEFCLLMDKKTCLDLDEEYSQIFLHSD